MSRRIKFMIVAGYSAGIVAIGLLWRASRRELPPEFAGNLPAPVGRLNSLAFSPNGRFLFAGSVEGAVIAWDWTHRESQVLAPSSHQPIVSLAVSSDDLLLASGLAGQIRGWQLPEFHEIKLKSPEVPVTAITFRKTTTDRAVLFGLADGRIATLSGGKVQLRKSGHRSVKALLLTSTQDVLISAGSEGKLIWFDLKSEKVTRTQSTWGAEISKLLSCPDNSRVVSADWNGNIRCWDTTGICWEAKQPDGISGLDWLDGRLVSASWDSKLRIWNCEATNPTLQVTIDTGRPIHGLAVVPQESLIATVSAERNVELWSIK